VFLTDSDSLAEKGRGEHTVKAFLYIIHQISRETNSRDHLLRKRNKRAGGWFPPSEKRESGKSGREIIPLYGTHYKLSKKGNDVEGGEGEQESKRIPGIF